MAATGNGAQPIDALLDERSADQLAAFTRFQVASAIKTQEQLARWPHRQTKAREDLLRDLPALLQWASTSFFGARVPAASHERLAIVLLSYNRPVNIAPIVRSYLRCELVSTVVVCNNNPNIDIRKHLGDELPKVRVIERERATRQGIRLSLAAELAREHRYVATIDDDIFLTPAQLQLLLDALVASPDGVHGFQGERRTRPGERPTWMFKNYDYVLGVTDFEGEVDHLTNAYFFTGEQAIRSVALARELGLGPLEELGNGEDLLISASGRRKPRLHRIGPVLQCLSSTLADVATCAKPSFFDERRRVVDLLQPTLDGQVSTP